MFILFLPTLVFANINKIIPQASIEYLGNKNISITLEPWGGRAGSPGYKITAFMDGTVIFDGTRSLGKSRGAAFQGVKLLKRDAEKFLPILDLIRRAKVLNPAERLSCKVPRADGGGYSLVISNEKHTQVTYANNGCDKPIEEILNEIRKLFFDAVDVDDLRKLVVKEQRNEREKVIDRKKCG